MCVGVDVGIGVGDGVGLSVDDEIAVEAGLGETVGEVIVPHPLNDNAVTMESININKYVFIKVFFLGVKLEEGRR